ncbi:MAG: hypothetical protein ACYDGR_17745, partial [Candidatus Dormibacteria bacterium]
KLDDIQKVLRAADSTDRSNWSTTQVNQPISCLRPGDACTGASGTPDLAVDAAGNAYAVYSDARHVFMARRIAGQSAWSDPVQVDQGLTSATYPTVVAGDDGRIAVAFYGSTGVVEDASSSTAQWWVYSATSTDATGSSPSFRQSLVSDHVAHVGAACSGCPYSGPTDATEMGTVIRATMDRAGRLLVAYTESRGIDGRGDLASVNVARQCSGVSLLKNPSLGTPCPPAGQRAVGSTSVGPLSQPAPAAPTPSPPPVAPPPLRPLPSIATSAAPAPLPLPSLPALPLMSGAPPPCTMRPVILAVPQPRTIAVVEPAPAPVAARPVPPATVPGHAGQGPLPGGAAPPPAPNPPPAADTVSSQVQVQNPVAHGAGAARKHGQEQGGLALGGVVADQEDLAIVARRPDHTDTLALALLYLFALAGAAGVLYDRHQRAPGRTRAAGGPRCR